MRTHHQIIADANGPAAIARVVGVDPGLAKQWKRNGSIPAPYWSGLAAAGVATLEELADAAAARRSGSEAA